jgi:hypothetical protein
MSIEPLIAVFVDFENLAIGVRHMKSGAFQIQLVLKRLLEKGRIVHKRAYCDWSNYRDAVREFHAQGIELIDIPQSKMSGKNSADIRMVVDAIDLCYAKQHSSTSDLLIANCDEFIYYDDLVRIAQKPSSAAKSGSVKKEDKKQEAFDRTIEVLNSLELDYDPPIWGSMLKQAIKRVHPGFNEAYYGYGTFSDLLHDIEESGLIELEFEKNRGNYQIRTRKTVKKKTT